MALPFLTLYLIRGLGLTEGKAATVLAVYGVTALCVGPVAGRLCDRLSSVRVMQGSLILSAAALLCFPWVKTLPGVLAMTVLWAASAEAFRPASMTSVSEYAPPELRKQAYALNRLAINVGMSAGPALGGFLAAWSFSSIFVVDGVTSALAAAMLFSVPAVAVGPVLEGPEARLPSRQALRDPRLLFFLIALLPVAVVFFQGESSMPLFLVRDLHLSPSFYGLLFTLNTLLIVAIEIPFLHATSHWSYRRCLALGSFLYAAGFGGLALARTSWQVAATVVVWTLGEIVLMPAASAYVSEISPARQKGEYMGLFIMAFSFAFIIGTSGGITALSLLGGQAFWVGTFLLASLSALMFLRLPRTGP